MAHELFLVVSWLAFTFAACGLVYLIVAIVQILAFQRRQTPIGGYAPPVTIFKPVCGAEPRLFENLCSFCDQDYPEFQVIFGVRDVDDPAIGIIRQVISTFPNRNLELVIDGRVRGLNLKIANVINMAERAKHDVFIIADSDMNVGRDYLRSIAVPFEDPKVGAVTCLYGGEPVGGVWSALEAMFINDIFVPSVLVARRLQGMRFCLGATMAVRRDVLESVGGFEVLASHLADDELLGRLVSQCGLCVALSQYIVRNTVHEPTFANLWVHELRWSRTMLNARPLGYGFYFITYALPLAAIAFAVSLNVVVGLSLIGAALALRVTLHYLARWMLRAPAAPSPWLIPLRDFLGLAQWAASFFGRSVRWRNQKVRIRSRGRL